MNLASPVTIQPPPYKGLDGTVKTRKPVTLSSLDVTIIDNAKRKKCDARISVCPFPLALWSGAEYDAAGDYTQAQVEARVLELLGQDVKAGIESLFVRPASVA